MGKINVLVLGVGGNVSQGIIKAITQSSIDCKIIGACVSAEAIGLYFCDKAYIAPYAQSDEFIPWLIDICNKEKINIVFTGVEENIIKIAANIEKFNQETKAIFQSSPFNKLLIGQDKLATSIWLRNHGCNFPRFSKSEEIESISLLVREVGYPLIAKPRKGKGSSGIILIHNHKDLEKVVGIDDYIIQEYIGNENTEYTVGCYVDKKGRLLNPVIMRRELKYGTTFKAEIVEDSTIMKEVIKICKQFSPVGPLNIQLRMDFQNRPVCFELNVRFSGTTPMRAFFGFNDVEAMIKEYVYNQDLPQQFEIRRGIAYRYMDEVYIESTVQDSLKNMGFIENIKNYRMKIDKMED